MVSIGRQRRLVYLREMSHWGSRDLLLRSVVATTMRALVCMSRIVVCDYEFWIRSLTLCRHRFRWRRTLLLLINLGFGVFVVVDENDAEVECWRCNADADADADIDAEIRIIGGTLMVVQKLCGLSGMMTEE